MEEAAIVALEVVVEVRGHAAPDVVVDALADPEVGHRLVVGDAVAAIAEVELEVAAAAVGPADVLDELAGALPKDYCTLVA